KIEIFQQPAVSDALSMQAVGAVESEVELLRSDEVALRVIKKLNLLEDPRFIGHNRPSFVRQLLYKFAPGYFAETPTPSEAELQNFGVKVFDADLIVDRVGVAYAIEIKFRSRYPDLAAEVANAVADAYIELQRTSEYSAARRASDWLEERMPELRAKSEAAEKAVVEYKNEHNIVEAGSGQLIEDERLADINIKLNAARDETLKAKARSDQFAALVGSGVPSAVVRGSNGNSVGSELEKLRSRYSDVASKEAEFSNL